MHRTQASSSAAAKTPPAIARKQVASAGKAVRFLGRCILVDLEGTLVSRSYFKDVLWRFAKRSLAGYLRTHWFDAAVERVREAIASDAGSPSFECWCKTDPRSAEAFVKLFDEVLRLYDQPVRTRTLMELITLVWCDGYRSASLSTHVYPETTAALKAWNTAGRDVRLFSSVTVAGQCALLAKTEQGNLLGYFRDHYDNQVGPKNAPGTYWAIADDMRAIPSEILYVSDDAVELDAARITGFRTAFMRRPGNPAPPANMLHPVIADFRSIHLPPGVKEGDTARVRIVRPNGGG